MEDLALRICEIAEEAGIIIKKVRSNFKEIDFEQKGDGSPVTLADLKANEIIVQSLASLKPGWPVISEEGSFGPDPKESMFSFLVDPLDGTKEFIRGNEMYTVNIALMKLCNNERWRPILGVVHAPDLETTWFGGEAVTPTRKNSRGMTPIHSKNSRKIPIIVGSVSHPSPKVSEFAEELGDHEFEGVGSSLKICRVAEGSADLAPRFGTTSCWDTAAAHAVLSSAGGALVDPNGLELDYDLVDEVLNPWFMATCDLKWIDLWMRHQN